jgi:hypothetical protein
MSGPQLQQSQACQRGAEQRERAGFRHEISRDANRRARAAGRSDVVVGHAFHDEMLFLQNRACARDTDCARAGR